MAPRRPPQPPPGPGPAGSSGTVGSADPNEKTGPAGFGPDHFIAAGLALPYRIDFENEASATAPAQRVVVTDQLDANLDWNTFGWTEVGFGDVLITIPPGSQHFQTTADMTFINRDFQVEIELDLNSQTGLLTAVFQSIDPATSLPPDVLTGFLPPEDGTGRGMGHISYTVEPRAGLATGAPIKNIGIISFDVNEPIATNQVNPHDPSQGADPNKESRSTLDAGTPISSVASLPGESEGAEVLVQWSGQDDADGSGVRGFDIYVSDDGGPFTLWLADTSLTEAVYTGQFDHGYAFYSIARDNVGHVEAPPAVPDAQTRTRQNLHVDARGPYTILEGEGVTLSAVIAGGDPSDVSWDVDADGVFDDATGPNPTLSWEQLQAIGVVDGPSSFAVRVRVNDSHGHEVTSAPTSLMVHNVPPAPDAGADQTVNEGEAVTLHGTFSDPGTADTHSFLWHVVASNGQVIADGSEPIFRFVPEDEGSYAVAFTVMDDDGGMNTSDMTVTVHNLPPTITAVTNDGPIRGGSSVTVTVAASDPAGAFDPLRYEFDCNGDGTYDIGPQAGDSASCTFASGGNYTVWVRVTDDDGGVNTGSTIVTVTAAVTGQILLLNGAVCGALSMTGNASVVIPGTLQINSNCQAALSAGGNSKLSASRIDVVGGISASGNARINPAPSTGVSSAGDPFASLAPPSDSTQLGSVKCKRGAQTLSPGTYFQITASNKCDLSLEPGTYIVAGGGIELSGQAKLTGADVLLYNAGSNFPKPGGSFGAFTVSGQARIELIPPSSGPFAGLSVFQARDNTRPISLSGGAAATMGTIYAPGAKLMLTGTGKLTAPLVVDTLKVTGNAASQLTTRVQRSTDTVEQAAAEKHRFTGIPKSVHVRAIDAVLADHAVPDDPEHHVRGR